MSSIDQADGALRAAKKSPLPVWVSFSVDDFDGSKLRSGEAVSDIIPVRNPCARRGFDQLFTPRSGQRWPQDCVPDGLPFGAYANGFTHISDGFLETSPTVDELSARQDLSPDEYARFAMEWISQGATIVGGCCEDWPHTSKSWPSRLSKLDTQLFKDRYDTFTLFCARGHYRRRRCRLLGCLPLNFKLGWSDVVLLERKQLTSGTTWHAAGLIAQLRATANMTKLAKYSQELYGSLEAETGVATGFKRVGSITVAFTEERKEEIFRSAAMARLWGGY